MKLLRKLLISIIVLIIIIIVLIGDLTLIKSYTSTHDLTISKVTDQLSLRIASAEEKYVKYQQFENWVVAITRKGSDLSTTARYIRNVVITILLVAVTSLVGYTVISRLIKQPTRTLENPISKIGNGVLVHHVEVRTKDELEQMGESSNTMSDNQKEILISYIYFSGLIASAEELTSLVARYAVR